MARKPVKILRELRKAKAVLIRQNNHQVWELPSGQQFVMSSTPSDSRAELNQLRDLRKLLQAK